MKIVLIIVLIFLPQIYHIFGEIVCVDTSNEIVSLYQYGSPWPGMARNQYHNALTPFIVGDIGGENKCSYSTLGELNSNPVIDNLSNTYIQDSLGWVYKINTTCGLVWKQITDQATRCGPLAAPQSPAIGTFGLIYVVTTIGTVYGISLESGEIMWSININNYLKDFFASINDSSYDDIFLRYPYYQGVSASPSIGSDGSVFVVSTISYCQNDKQDINEKIYPIYRFDGLTGNVTSPTIEPETRSVYSHSSLAHHNGYVYYGDDYAIALARNENGNMIYTNGFALSDSIRAYMTLTGDGRVVATLFDGSMYVINFDTNELVDKNNNPAISTPNVGVSLNLDNEAIYVGEDGHLYRSALYEPRNSTIWKNDMGKPNNNAVPVIDGDGKYIVCYADTIYVIDKSGNLSSSNALNATGTPAVDEDGSLLIPTNNTLVRIGGGVPQACPLLSPNYNSLTMDPCIKCGAGEYLNIVNGTCDVCNIGKYTKITSSSTSCLSCDDFTTTLNTGSTSCDAYSFKLPFWVAGVYLGFFLLLYLFCLPFNTTRKMDTLLLSASSLLDLTSDIAYVSINTFANKSLFIAAIFFGFSFMDLFIFCYWCYKKDLKPKLLIEFPLFYFTSGKLIWLRRGKYINSNSNSSSSSSSNEIDVELLNQTYWRPFCESYDLTPFYGEFIKDILSSPHYDSLLKWFLGSLVWLPALLLQTIFCFLYLCYFLINIHMVLVFVVGLLFFETRLMVNYSIQNLFIKMFTGKEFDEIQNKNNEMLNNENSINHSSSSTSSCSDVEASHKSNTVNSKFDFDRDLFNESLLYETCFETIPMAIIQILNAIYVNELNNIAIINAVVTSVIILDNVLKFIYYKLIENKLPYDVLTSVRVLFIFTVNFKNDAHA